MKPQPALADYRHKVHLGHVAQPPLSTDDSFASWFDALPAILGGGDVAEAVDRWVAARRAGRPVIWGFGAHVVKVGLSRWVIALMEEGLVTRLAVNGAVAIHDFELAAVGHTSEEVGEAVREGLFGRAAETAPFINGAAVTAAREKIGLGAALGQAILDARLPHGEISILGAASRLGIPVTVHLALGTDTVHSHPSADGAALGEATLADFRLFCEGVAGLEGGCYWNVGSAVLLPELFLKAVALARAGGAPLDPFTAVVLDFQRHYRPLENVTRRPLGPGSRGIYLVGHHEILVPLLAQAARSRYAAP